MQNAVQTKKGQKFMKKKNLAFTLAEVLIVIGIIGVVAALTLPNLNRATGDKETVTRLQKAYSILSEANDRAVAIYGPISSWKSNEQCADDIASCWTQRVGEFLKIAKKCDGNDGDICDMPMGSGKNQPFNYTSRWTYVLSDGMVFNVNGGSVECNYSGYGLNGQINDVCFDEVKIDVNGRNKGKSELGKDVFEFVISDSLGVIPLTDNGNLADEVSRCVNKSWQNEDEGDDQCGFWVLEYGNLDYLKTDNTGKCSDSNIILDGTTNTSCH